MLQKRKWWLSVLVVAISLLFITGCTDKSGNESDTTQETPAATNNNEETDQEAPAGEENKGNTQTNEGQAGEGQAPNVTGLEADEDLETKLEKEKGIENVMVQVVEGDQKAVNVDIQITDPQTLSADEIIEKYSEVIKKKYPDHTIDVIVAKEGKILKQTTIE